MKIDGIKIADEIVKRLKGENAPKKILAAIFVGDDTLSDSFLKQKQQTAERLGIDFRIYNLPDNLNGDDLRHKVSEISAQEDIGGAIVQLPLPSGIDKQYVLNAVPSEKDVDVLGEHKLGGLLQPAVETFKEIIEREKVNLEESVVVVLGKGVLVGKPIGNWLEGKCKELYILDSKSDPSKIKEADIIVSGVGRAGLIDPNNLKVGAGVIDFGYSNKGKLVGDLNVENESALDRLKFYTPTPGGTGPILVAKLFENFYKLCGRQ
ncbi:MAG: hypothetical protein A3I33_01455 [Candidatus Colwellbacteria bacterium RIFCSPLOWO2_02_FULL_45_11]|uniref:Methenyltetrahydrofolate cyclohydrolase n=1 Tax=Candidatus Colwellbacteria bacterium RIFCSPLOWO2_02_FULL_45_11 TaxID=1797692 RepID=A0A1G1Z8Z7_9BACT|nr:MAG: hypothetical protein A3I33_01455 [Candidatus Colwellbacteria bacterium RIFCSPLOWO2_02_FULL_45_11]